jgi:hypothetical protein
MVGHVETLIRNAKGEIVERSIEGFNLVVDTGLAALAGALSGDTATPSNFKYIGIGTDATAEDHAQTALLAEVESRATGTQGRTTGSVANDTYTLSAAVSCASARTLNESGIFNSATPSGSTMLARKKFLTVKNVDAGGSITVNWTMKFTAV